MTDINTQIQKNESLPGNVKETSQAAADGLGQLKKKMGPLGKLAEMYGHDLNPLAIKQNVAASLVKQVFGLDFGGTPSEEEPERKKDPEWAGRMGLPDPKDLKE